MNNFKIYMYLDQAVDSRIVYLDGSASEGYSYQYAVELARDNASSMPGKRIYIENGDTGKDECSYINIDGVISVELYG